MTPPVPVLIITGPLGAGKTAVLLEASEILRDAGIAFAAVDLDALSWSFPPAPGDDRFRSGVAFRNLAAAWRTYREAGAPRVAIAYVVESRDELARYREAIPGAEITVARLRASDDTLQRRIASREIGMRRDRQLGRARELVAIMDRERVEDFVVETDGRPVHEVAGEVLRRARWLPG